MSLVVQQYHKATFAMAMLVDAQLCSISCRSKRHIGLPAAVRAAAAALPPTTTSTEFRVKACVSSHTHQASASTLASATTSAIRTDLVASRSALLVC